MKKRDVRDEERALWEHVTRDVRKPARKRKTTAKSSASGERDEAKAGQARPAKAPTREVAPPPRKSGVAMPGLDGATAERLRRGKVVPDAMLDLHGMTQDQAHARLLSFVRRAYDNGYRCVMVITGKGSPLREDQDVPSRGFTMPERSKAGVLRAQVPSWLAHADTRAIVVGTQRAHARHGGEGALYVYLRRNRS